MEYIYSYSRAQALSDGVLVDMQQWPVTAQHWKIPTACTDTLFNLMESAVLSDGKDYDGIIHDISTMAKLAINANRAGDRDVFFKAIIGRKLHELKLNIGPGDDPRPVLTFMLRNES